MILIILSINLGLLQKLLGSFQINKKRFGHNLWSHIMVYQIKYLLHKVHQILKNLQKDCQNDKRMSKRTF